MDENHPRIRSLPFREWPKEMKAALAPLTPPTPRDPDAPKGMNVLGLQAQHPALAAAFNTFNAHVLYGSTISARHRELLVLRVAVARQADYEWAQHATTCTSADIATDELAEIIAGPDSGHWPPLEAALLRAVDELVADAAITDDTWAILAAEFDDQQLLDIIFTVGIYELLAMAMRSAGLKFDDDLPPSFPRSV